MRLSLLKHLVPSFLRQRGLHAAASFRSLGHAMPVIEFTPEGIIQKASPLFLAAMGYRADQIVGQHHSMFCPSALVNSPEYRRFWQRLAAGESFSDKYLRLASGMRPVWLEASYIPVTDRRGRVFKIVKIAADISERMQSSLEQESIINAISRSMAVIAFSPDGHVLEANDNFLKATGYQAAEVTGKHHRLFCSDELSQSEEYRQFWVRLNQGEFFSGQFPRLTGVANRSGSGPLTIRFLTAMDSSLKLLNSPPM